MLALRCLTAAAFLTVFACYVAVSLHWSIIGDGATMHYVIFLLRHGKLPYADITDMNMPGTYLTEQAAMTLFGSTDLAWRIYEFFLLSVLAVSSIAIAGRRRWLAGIFATTFFIALHAAEGPLYSVERDELMTVLLFAAFAFLFISVRKQQPRWVLGFGLLAGLAASIKPTAVLLDVAGLLLLWIALRRRQQPALTFLWWGLAGNAVVLLAVLAYLWHYHAMQSFLFILREVLPAYAASTPQSAHFLLRQFIPDGVLRLLPFAVAAGLLRSRSRSGDPLARANRADAWERWTLLVCAAFGALSYFMQGKGYLHHRYLFVAFLLLWIGIELTDAMQRSDRWSRTVGATGILVLLLLVLPHYLRVLQRETKPGRSLGGPGIPGAQLATQLERDLTHLDVDRLQNRVVCLDLVNSCLSTLYRLRLMQNTAFTGDMLLFSSVETSPVRFYRQRFMALQAADPADVVVLNNEWFEAAHSDFHKLEAWPAYKAWLEENYVAVRERSLPGSTDTQAYRLYLRKGSNVLADEQAHPLP